MRRRLEPLLGCLLLWGTLPVSAASTDRLRIVQPKELHVGERSSLAVNLDLPPDAASPLLLTQSVEGEALEVVRGRLTRRDARDSQARQLAFDIPVLARAPGTSVVRVHALIYVCEVRCQARELEARVSVVVLGGAP